MAKNNRLSSQIPDIGRKLTKFTGKEFIERVGDDAIRDVVTSILSGGNVRSLTEGLTQRRILLSNGALLVTYLRGLQNIDGFDNNLTSIVTNELLDAKLRPEEKIFLQWFIGLTGKSIQNVLRSDPERVNSYLKEYNRRIEASSHELVESFGNIEATIQIDNKNILLQWPSLLKLFYAVGTQTLALRGSEKSMYGKLFEKLILGSMLTILGFEQINPDESDKSKMVFWLSQRDSKRESDATILVKPGVGARFDLGFIGPGNTEISLDKVSRFEREMDYGRQLHYMSTIILVDRIGDGSRISEMAKEINGSIIQMSMSNWIKEVVDILNDKLKYKHEIYGMSNDDTLEYIKSKMSKVNLQSFITLSNVLDP